RMVLWKSTMLRDWVSTSRPRIVKNILISHMTYAIIMANLQKSDRQMRRTPFNKMHMQQMRNNRNRFDRSLFDQLPVIGILRDVSLEDAEIILPLFIEAGFTTIEVPINSKDAEELIHKLTLHFGEKLNIGAGSVIDLSDLDKAFAAGAEFIVTPVVDEKVITSCVSKGIPVFPGAFSPTEIAKAWKLGATMVKVFPADEMGPRYIKALKAPLKHIKLLPTGGISIENANDYFLAGAEGIGVSTGLFKSELIKNKDWDRLGEHLRSFHQIIGDRKL